MLNPAGGRGAPENPTSGAGPVVADAGPGGPGHGFRRLYDVPERLTPPQRFEHWRHWYSQAVETPVRLEATGPVSPHFSPTATSFSGPGFSLIELRNGPAAGAWEANGDLDDLRLAYFVKAPSGTYNFSGEPVSIQSPRVRFLDLTHGGKFRAPAGMHVIQLNLAKSGLGVDGVRATRLAEVENLIQHPVLRSLLMPLLLNCRAAGMEAHAEAASAVLRSAVTALTSSLLGVPAAPESLAPSQRLAVKNYLDRNYASENMGSEAIADHFHVSRRTLFTLFEGEDVGIAARVRLLRTARALELLRDPEWRLQTVDRIAATAGFANTQALRRALKDVTGLGVRELREDHKALEERLAALRRTLGA